jgi:penicillin-binding protein 1A
MAGDHLSENFEAVGAWFGKRRAFFARLFTIVVAIVVIPSAVLFLLPTVLSWLAPPLDLNQDLYAVNRPVAFTFLDADGGIVGHRGAIIGERLKLEEMPPYLPAAFIAMEDRSFYSNQGFDVRGLMRASIENMRAGHVVAGGSTITQQTAKIVFLSQERTFNRKLQEFLDAAELAKSLTKKQILELYLNRIYLGSGAYGVDGAAHVYFNKSARDLTLPEAAMLATLTRADLLK